MDGYTSSHLMDLQNLRPIISVRSNWRTQFESYIRYSTNDDLVPFGSNGPSTSSLRWRIFWYGGFICNIQPPTRPTQQWTTVWPDMRCTDVLPRPTCSLTRKHARMRMNICGNLVKTQDRHNLSHCLLIGMSAEIALSQFLFHLVVQWSDIPITRLLWHPRWMQSATLFTQSNFNLKLCYISRGQDEQCDSRQLLILLQAVMIRQNTLVESWYCIVHPSIRMESVLSHFSSLYALNQVHCT